MEARSSTIAIPWRSQLRHPRTAPRNGAVFHGITKGSAEPARLLWDAEMNCFLSSDFACVDELACWWPPSGAAYSPIRTVDPLP